MYTRVETSNKKYSYETTGLYLLVLSTRILFSMKIILSSRVVQIRDYVILKTTRWRVCIPCFNNIRVNYWHTDRSRDFSNRDFSNRTVSVCFLGKNIKNKWERGRLVIRKNWNECTNCRRNIVTDLFALLRYRIGTDQWHLSNQFTRAVFTSSDRSKRWIYFLLTIYH